MSNLAVIKPVTQLQPHEIEALCKSDPAAAAAQCIALLKGRTDLFPGTTFVKRGNNGMLMKVAKQVVLSEANKQVLKLKTKKSVKGPDGQWSDKWSESHDFTAAGYRTINSVVGLLPIKPETVVVGDRRQPNPCIIDDETSHTPRLVYCRMVVIGPARDTGTLVATDVMLRFDLNLYFIEGLIAKLGYLERDGKDAAFGVPGTIDQETRPKVTPGTYWKFYPVVGEVGFWFNILHPAFKNAIKDHSQRLKFADRIAQTVAERNAMKAHPGMPGSGIDLGDGNIGVNAVGWTANYSPQDLERLRRMVEDGTLGSEPVAGRTVEVQRVEVTEQDQGVREEAEVVAEEELGVQDHDIDAEPIQPAPAQATVNPKPAANPKPAVKSEPQKPEQKPAPKQEAKPAGRRAELLAAAKKVYAELCEASGKKSADAHVAAAGVTKIEEMTDEQLADFADDIPF